MTSTEIPSGTSRVSLARIWLLEMLLTGTLTQSTELVGIMSKPTVNWVRVSLTL